MDKQDLIEEFEMAKSIELSAAELYDEIASAPDIEDQSIKTTPGSPVCASAAAFLTTHINLGLLFKVR